jgi:hypothetical protein
MLVFVFAKPLSIPSPWELVPAGTGFVCLYLFFRGNKKLQRERLREPEVVVPLAARKMRFGIIAFALIAGSIGCIPLLPYMVDDFRPDLYFYVIPADAVFLGIVVFYFRKKFVGSADPPQKSGL